MNKQNKECIFIMRTAQADKKQIAQLAKSLNCKQSEAVRQAIRYTLANMPKNTVKS